jgi:hypothetical protein
MAASEPVFFVHRDPTTHQFEVVRRNVDGREFVVDSYDREVDARGALIALSGIKIARR